jgi:aspartyl-tRNA(Asn)/glutamyl-tRNA(Gln) amidotransferase subunit A
LFCHWSTFSYFIFIFSEYDRYFKKAQQIRNMISSDFKHVFKTQKIDALITPTTIKSKYTIEEFQNLSPINSYLNDIFTVPSSLAGLPSISVSYKKSKYPIGIQFISDYLNEEALLKISNIFENSIKK